MIYARETSSNGWVQNLAGNALATLLEDQIFLDLRGFAGMQSTTGGYTPVNDAGNNRDNQVQTISLSASPYVVHRFGDIAVAQLGYGYQYLRQDGNSAFLPGATQPFFQSSETNFNQGYLVVRTGEAFGRSQFDGRVIGTSASGTGPAAGSHQFFASLQGLYAVTRQYAAFSRADMRTRPIREARLSRSPGQQERPGCASPLTPTAPSPSRTDIGTDTGHRVSRLA